MTRFAPWQMTPKNVAEAFKKTLLAGKEIAQQRTERTLPNQQYADSNEVSGIGGRAFRQSLKELAPQVGLEPTTLRLTAECSAIELLRSVLAGTVLNCL
jgi:hypothetical protein